jgi:hypothetical protein
LHPGTYLLQLRTDRRTMVRALVIAR